MNPYDFVRINWNTGVKRDSPVPHNSFSGISGQIHGTITTLKPFFIPESVVRSPRHYLVNGKLEAIIPGSSLKGLIRSLVETIGPGCWWLFDGTYDKLDYKNKLPRAFHQCPDRSGNLCIACRMFGLIQQGGDMLHQGYVGFNDAVCAKPTEHPAIYTIILGGPKPRHGEFYLDSTGKNVAGRKYYFHQSTPPVDAKGWLPKGAPLERPAQNTYIKPVGPESIFDFSAHFNNLSQDDLHLLLYALVLEPNMRHQIGYAKPAGLGSVQIHLTRLETIDYTQRYSTANGGKTIYKEGELQNYLQRATSPFVRDAASITLQDLRRIWAWPGRDDIQYPGWQWFQDPNNAQKDLSQTP